MNQLSNLAVFWNVGNLTSLALIVLFATTAKAEPTSVKLSHFRGNVYVVVDDYPLSDENSAVYIGKRYVTVVGATFSPATAFMGSHMSFI